MSCDRSTNTNNSNSINTNQPNNHIINDYIILQKLGQGTFCKVKLGIHRPTNAKVAIKILKKKHLTHKNDFLHVQREFDMITSFSHHNVISVAEIIQNKDNFYIVMEYCQKGELFNYIVNKHQLKEQEASFFYYQLINGSSLGFISGADISESSKLEKLPTSPFPLNLGTYGAFIL